MDTIKIAGVQFDNLAEELFSEKSKQDQALGVIRTLDDWELALAGGGDNLPEFP